MSIIDQTIVNTEVEDDDNDIVESISTDELIVRNQRLMESLGD